VCNTVFLRQFYYGLIIHVDDLVRVLGDDADIKEHELHPGTVVDTSLDRQLGLLLLARVKATKELTEENHFFQIAFFQLVYSQG